MHVTLPDVGALMIVFLQEKFKAEATVLNSTFADNHDFCFRAVFALMRTSSTDQAHPLFEGCTITDNSPVLSLVGGGRWKSYYGSHVTTYMQYEGSSYNETQCVSITDSYLRGPYDSTTPSLPLPRYIWSVLYNSIAVCVCVCVCVRACMHACVRACVCVCVCQSVGLLTYQVQSGSGSPQPCGE